MKIGSSTQTAATRRTSTTSSTTRTASTTKTHFHSATKAGIKSEWKKLWNKSGDTNDFETPSTWNIDAGKLPKGSSAAKFLAKQNASGTWDYTAAYQNPKDGSILVESIRDSESQFEIFNSKGAHVASGYIDGDLHGL